MLLRYALLIAVMLMPGTIHLSIAQIISPGELTAAHASLAGLNNCGSCHDFGVRGISPTKCLDCHTPLASRIAQSMGFHGGLETTDCGSCHKEHFGKTFDPIRFDTLAFDHKQSGFELLSSHTTASCSACHTPSNIVDDEVVQFKSDGGSLSRTFLGVATTCVGCHEEDDPHQGQFVAATCASCHDETEWPDAPVFRHDEATFPLTGQHTQVACASCHPATSSDADKPFIQYSGIAAAECGSCHEDPHVGEMGSTCSSCHSTSGFNNINRSFFERTFDHTKTSFKLVGSHQALACASCHSTDFPDDISMAFRSSRSRQTYPQPIVSDCESCHLDYHDDSFSDSVGGSVCSNCHGESGWAPTTFGIERHNNETAFELVGSHQALPCTFCHASANFAQGTHGADPENLECINCHEDDNVHGSTLAETTACSECHSATGWQDLAPFDHRRTSFPLTGRHAVTSCSSCHVAAADLDNIQVPFSRQSTNCVDCHEPDNPHHEQFVGVSCSSCHSNSSFTVTMFNHDLTQFPLSTAHVSVPCQSCHLEESPPTGKPFRRFKPVTTRCEDCH